MNLTGKKWKHNLLGSASYFYRTKNTYFKDLTTVGIGTIAGKDEQDTTQISSAQIRYLNSTRLFKTISMNSGIDYNYESLLGKRIENNQQSISSLSLIAIASYSYKKRIDVKIGARQTIHSLNHIPTIPSMSIRWKINPKYELKLNVAKAYRTPGIKELYLYFVDINHNIKGNPELLSESSINYNINISKKDVIKQKIPFRIQCNVFHNRFRNLISLAALNLTEYTYVNIGKSIISGINTDLNLQFKKFDFSVKNAILSTSNNLEIADIPNYFNTINYSFISTYKTGKNNTIKFNVFVNRFGKTPVVTLVDTKPTLAHNAGYTMIDMTSQWPVKFKKTDINFSMGLRNIANISNIKMTLSNGIAHQSSGGQRMISTGRTIFFGLDFKI
jgi:outer membrane receptor for ferrienterochelin and colicins